MIKYLGSKRTLVPDLLHVLSRFPGLVSVADLFSGTARVGHAFKRAGYRVHSNDHNEYARTLARCYVEADRERVETDARRILEELAHLPPRPGYFTETFCVKSRYVQPHNGARIDAMREAVAQMRLEPVLESVILVSIMEAADRVDSTCGLQMAYLKKWSKRSHGRLELRMPDVLPAAQHGPCTSSGLDAIALAQAIAPDVAYLDPPYNQHSYLSNYHVWESLVRWDKPETYGVACKRVDCRERKSAFNGRLVYRDAMEALLGAVRAKLVLVSFSDEGFFKRDVLESMLGARGDVVVLERDFPRYIGARIGIFNPKGKRVGRVGRVRNTEHIFVLAPREGGLDLSSLREPDAVARAG